MRGSRVLLPPQDRDPLRVMFVIGSMPVGGAERLLMDLLRGFDRSKFLPELCCLREPDVLGDQLAEEIPVFSEFTDSTYDVMVLGPLARLMKDRMIDAVVTVGVGGDNMFWGRLAASMADVPVVCSALHSTATGSSEHVEWVNRLLTPFTDAFIAVTKTHARELIEREKCPSEKVHAIQNGVHLGVFSPRPRVDSLCTELGIWPDRRTVGVVARLRPEKNLEMFLETAKIVCAERPKTQFVIVGDGPDRAELKQKTLELQISDFVHFVGPRDDIPNILSLFDVFLLTSSIENCPPALLEAMACEVPAVATRIGSVPEIIRDGESGYLTPVGDPRTAAARVLDLLTDEEMAAEMGRRARDEVTESWSLPAMVKGYEDLLAKIYREKCAQPEKGAPDLSKAIEMLS